MPLFAVTVERGPSWDWSVPMRRQAQWDAHAAFMDALVSENFIVAGGPLGDEDRAVRILHIVRAHDRSAIVDRLGSDPWERLGLLKISDIEAWTVLLGSLVPYDEKAAAFADSVGRRPLEPYEETVLANWDKRRHRELVDGKWIEADPD